MKHNLLICTLSAAIMTLASASSWSQEQQPIDCATANEDIATLQGEMENTNDKIAKGLFSFTPIGLVANEADKYAHTGDKTEKDMHTYNQVLQQKIDAIKATCNIDSQLNDVRYSGLATGSARGATV